MNNNFAENIKKIRKDNNLSQEQLAEELGVSRQAISKWESSQAYPEMDKIIALCERFNLNIDDLLHKDIREVKGEEESKKKANKYIEDFLNFITDTMNFISSMSFKTKVKCFIEQCFIILILFLLSTIVRGIVLYVLDNILIVLPRVIISRMNPLINCVINISLLVVSGIILIHIFKVRYLDYYTSLKKEDQTNQNNQNKKEEELPKKERIELKTKENKIVIRDPKHSEYKFFDGLAKLIINIIKFFALCFSLFLCFSLIGIAVLFVMSFMVIKTNLFFVGCLGVSLSSAIIDIIFILIIFNFVFNRKNEKKKMIYTFLIALVMFGISCGFMMLGVTNFDIIDKTKEDSITKSTTLAMQENLFFSDYLNINYVETESNDIKIEYKTNEFCEVTPSYNSSMQVHLWSHCDNPMKMMRYYMKNLNDKKIVYLDTSPQDITVYTSKSNIEKMQQNKQKYEENNNNRLDEIQRYEESLARANQTINEYESKIVELEAKITELENQLNEQ